MARGLRVEKEEHARAGPEEQVAPRLLAHQPEAQGFTIEMLRSSLVRVIENRLQYAGHGWRNRHGSGFYRSASARLTAAARSSPDSSRDVTLPCSQSSVLPASRSAAGEKVPSLPRSTTACGWPLIQKQATPRTGTGSTVVRSPSTYFWMNSRLTPARVSDRSKPTRASREGGRAVRG